MKSNNNIFLLGLGFLMLVGVALLVVFLLKDKKKKNEPYRLLEITPAKKCCGGPYMWGNKNSPTFKYCSNPDNQDEISRVCCYGCRGFVGRPVSFSYTPESNAMWENERCNCPMSLNAPPVL